jgi:hypothetical protein
MDHPDCVQPSWCSIFFAVVRSMMSDEPGCCLALFVVGLPA